jgi:hypothetical protein
VNSNKIVSLRKVSINVLLFIYLIQFLFNLIFGVGDGLDKIETGIVDYKF